VKRRPFCEPYLTLGTLAVPITSPPRRPKGRTGQRAMVSRAFVTDHREPHPACCPLRRNLAGRVLPLTCYDATAWTRYWRATSRRRRPGSCIARATPACQLNTMGGAPGAARARTSPGTAHTTGISVLALACLLIKQATANVRSLPMVAALSLTAEPSTRAAGFLKATCLGQPLCVEPDAICEIRSTHDAPPPGRAPTWPLGGQ